MAPIRSPPRICLSTYPAAPATIASKSASSSANEVNIREPGPELTADGYPVPVGQPDVEHGHIGVEHRDPSQRLSGCASLAHHHQVGLELEQLVYSPSDDFVIVYQEDPDGVGHHAPHVPPAVADDGATRRGG